MIVYLAAGSVIMVACQAGLVSSHNLTEIFEQDIAPKTVILVEDELQKAVAGMME